MSCLFPFASTSRSHTLDAFSDEKRSSAPPPNDEFPRANFVEDDRTGSRHDREHALTQLKTEMEDRKIDVYVVPTEDEHLSEYIAKADQRRAFISGFTGTAGTAIITRTDNLLYVDSRYWVQAKLQVSSAWTVKRVGDKDQKDWATDLIDSSDSLRVGIDPSVISGASGGTHSTSVVPLLDAPNLTVVPIAGNLVDLVWTSQPSRPTTLIDLHPIQFTGLHASKKIKAFLKAPTLTSTSHTSEGYFLSTLDELCWLLNLRCVGDIPNTPVFHAYLWIPLSMTSPFATTLFVNPVKLSPEASAYLAELGIAVQPYEAVWPFLELIGKSLSSTAPDEKPTKKRVVLTGQSVTWKTQLLVGKDSLVSVVSPILEAKAVKNETELEGMRAAYKRDGLATVRWMARLDKLITREGGLIDEYDAAELLTKFRSKGEHFRGLAYENISASGPNGALPHYSPVKGKCRIIDRETPYTNDSGAQYLDGTIDTTRTWHFGTPSEEQKDAFTRVLQGHIAVDTVVFPTGTAGAAMNILARKALWQAGLDFGHGVGHGIGSYLSVHEGPQGIALPYPFRVGHVISNEPGYYKEGHWGMRVESALEVIAVSPTSTTTLSSTSPPFLAFRRLTRVPIQTSLIDPDLLSPVERKWVQDHNDLCRADLLPLLQRKEDKEARKWLERC